MKRVFVDVETTGFDFLRNDIISICMIIKEGEKEIDRLIEYVRPENYEFWYDQSEEIHGISREQSKEFQSRKSCADKILKLVESLGPWNENIFINHAPYRKPGNLTFDYGMLYYFFYKQDLHYRFNKHLEMGNSYNTIKGKAEKFVWQDAGLENQKLSTWAKYLNFDLNHHEVVSDTECLVKVYEFQNPKEFTPDEILQMNFKRKCGG